MVAKDSSTCNNRFVLFEIVDVENRGSKELNFNEDIYIRNKESGLYLASDAKMLSQFTSVLLSLYS